MEKLLISELNKKFPGGGYTTYITKWMDDTFLIDVRHTEPDNLSIVYNWRWYNGKIKYIIYRVDKNSLIPIEEQEL